MDWPSPIPTSIITEVPSGTIDGSNLVFTLSNTPRSGGLLLIADQIIQVDGVTFNLSGTTITFVDGNEPFNSLRAIYPKA